MGDRHLDPERFRFAETEARLSAAAEQELGEPLELAQTAIGYLADGLWQSELGAPATEPPDATYLRQSAIHGLSALGVRTGRALVLLVRCGWEPEAHAPKRRLTEITLRSRAVLEDHSGEAARQWLDGRAPSAGQLMSRYDAKRPWNIFSSGAHADPRSLRLIMVPPPWVDVPHEQRAVQVTPLRDRRHAEGLLLECAWEAQLLLVALVEALGASLAIGGEYEEQIVGARERFEARWKKEG
jgi:hypothetical protein